MPDTNERPRSDENLKTLSQRQDQLAGQKLYVLCPVINASRSRKRWSLFEDFRRHCSNAGAVLFTIEVAFGDREFVVTSEDNPYDIRLRTWHELWLKERAINVGVQHLTRLIPNWEKMAWADGDFFFVRPDWANEILHLLEHWPVIQCWTELTNVTVNYEIKSQLRSLMAIQFEHPGRPPGNYYEPGGQKFGSPGLCWAARREAIEQMGGPLLDVCALGAGDWYQSSALLGTLDEAIKFRNDLSPAFADFMLKYQEHLRRARWQGRSVVGNVGLMRGLAVHFWHGSRANRQYNTRGQILMRHGYDPDRDLMLSANGLYQLTDRSPGLRADISRYFASLDSDALS